MNTLHIIDDNDYLDSIAQTWIQIAQQSIEKKDRFYVALSGGSTPKKLYQRLAQSPYVEQLDWSKVYFFFSDERCVPLDHADSNYRMVNEALFSKLDDCHIFPMIHQPEAPEEDAIFYCTQLQLTLGEDARFDLMMLGMGDDGHTASLFPNSPMLASHKRVDSNYEASKGNSRLSFTLHQLPQTHHSMVLISGASKADMLSTVLADNASKDYPIVELMQHMNLEWYIDQSAAEKLPK